MVAGLRDQVSGAVHIAADDPAVRSSVLPIAQQAIALWRTGAAIPGPVTSATSTGCHRLIHDGDTHLITCATDIIDLLDDPKS